MIVLILLREQLLNLGHGKLGHGILHVKAKKGYEPWLASQYERSRTY